MKIVIDLQGAQAVGSRHRGIGRYSLALTQALARQRRTHDLHIALSDAFPETIEPLRAALEPLVGADRIHLWSGQRRVAERDAGSRWRRECGELVREAHLASLKPDVVHAFSLFEGFADDTLTSVGEFAGEIATSATLHDLIPLIYGNLYRTDPLYDRWYRRKLECLRRANLCLANSESSRREGIDWLGLPEEWSVSVPGAADAMFRPLALTAQRAAALRARYGLNRPFVMYTGGGDPRKNIAGLIGAYARLPEPLRRKYQLAIVCSASEREITALKAVAARSVLAPDDVVFTGFVPDADMVALYNLSTLFAFPSLHEGFGLPALEAMQCGVPVIGSNTSSLPEVIGRTDALFDPRDESDMAAKLTQALGDSAFRDELARHAPQQARKFSWDASARIALDAFERLHAHRQRTRLSAGTQPAERPLLAFVSPLPPQRSGIATYSSELLPELGRHYRIEVVTNTAVDDPWIEANCRIRDVEWFGRNGGRYDRILYHFGNSEFHAHMFDLLECHPGTVVLHDFYLSGVIWHMDWTGSRPGALVRALWESHGYPALRALARIGDSGETVWHYPANRAVLDQADGVIVHSQYSRRLAEDFYGKTAAAKWVRIPHLRKLPVGCDRAAARRRLGLGENDFLLCAFGIMGRAKLNHRLLEAWNGSALAKDGRCRLVFVGENDRGPYGQEIVHAIQAGDGIAPVTITGFAPADLYRTYLEAADAAVQLRTLSRGETSGTVHDCMAYGVPTAVNLNGSLSEFQNDCLLQLPDEFDVGELRAALERLHGDPAFRRNLGDRGRRYIADRHDPGVVAGQYRDAIEAFAADGPQALRRRLVRALRRIEPEQGESPDWLSLARNLAANHPVPGACRLLLVDISELVRTDAKTGIQRVVRSVLAQLLANPPSGYRVETVYASPDGRYRLACTFTAGLLGVAGAKLEDAEVEPQAGDVLLGLDLAPHLVPQCLEQLRRWRNAGVRLYFMVHDILPLRRPEWFAPGAHDIFRCWLEAVAEVADGLVCVTRTVADDVLDWLGGGTAHQRLRPLRLGWSHNGADILASLPTRGRSHDFDEILAQFAGSRMVMMVGTLEPRKGHLQAIEAFEALWREGAKDRLVIVGKAGWMTDGLIGRLSRHPELNRRLFWFEGASDEMLMELYERADGVLMASEGEGFGLPLIEAAQHHKPILARDIPVFREIAGDAVRYFSAADGTDLAVALRSWLAELAAGTAPRSDAIVALSWEQSTQRLLEVVLGGQWHSSWTYDVRRRYRGDDHRLQTEVGIRGGGGVAARGNAGMLLRGPGVPLRAGRYSVTLRGLATDAAGRIEAVAEAGALALGSAALVSRTAPDEESLAQLEFELRRDCSDFEVRVQVAAGADLFVSALAIEALDSDLDEAANVDPGQAGAALH